MNNHVGLITLLLMAGCCCPASGPPEYRVLRVIDGDTFTIHYDGEETRVRIADIDAPEIFGKAEPGGPESKAALEKLIAGRSVRLEFGDHKRDHYGRLLARVFVGDFEVG